MKLLHQTDRMTRAKLPEYDHPPAVETLMGFYFPHQTNWNPLLFGKLWALFEPEYPKGSLAPFIIDSPPANVGSIQATFGTTPYRAIFTDVADSALVQVQNSAFLRNWRKTEQNKPYTHYSDLKPKFEHDWRKFLDFLEQNQLQRPVVIQAEVTYVNHLLRGDDWNSYNDVAKLLKPIAPRTGVADNGRLYTFLPEAATFQLHVGYNLADMNVGLQVQVQSAIRPDGKELLQLTLTAKGAPQSSTDEALSEALDRCHDAVILGFDDITTQLAHRKWGKR
jgi:uncharacterized protein (TIGR04255 family)